MSAAHPSPGPLGAAILQALMQEGAEAATDTAGISLPRLSKRLGLSASAVLRELSFLGDAVIGGQPGPGWVRVWQHEGRWMIALTDAGRAASTLDGKMHSLQK